MVWHVNTDTLFIFHFFPFSLNQPYLRFSNLCNLLDWYLPLLTGIIQYRFWSWSRRWYPSYLSKRRGKVWCTLNFGFRDETEMLWILISLWFFVYRSLLIMQIQQRDSNDMKSYREMPLSIFKCPSLSILFVLLLLLQGWMWMWILRDGHLRMLSSISQSYMSWLFTFMFPFSYQFGTK